MCVRAANQADAHGQERSDRCRAGCAPAARRPPLALPRGGADRDRLRLLLVERRRAQHARRHAIDQLHAAIVTRDRPLRARLAASTPAALANPTGHCT
jgi:hypothetical protein